MGEENAQALNHADKFYENSSPVNINAAQATPMDLRGTVQQLAKQMTILLTRMDKMDKRARLRSRSRSRSRSRACRLGNASNNTTQDTGQCYYHRRFGDQARKCESLCSAKTKAIQGNK